MRRDQHVLQLPQRVAVRQRLRIRDVERGAPDRARAQRLDERVRVDHRAARDVDQPRVLAHRLQLAGADEVARAAGGRGGDHDVRRLAPHLADVGRSRSEREAPWTGPAAPRHGDRFGPERLQHRDQRAADAARAHDQHRRVLERVHAVAPLAVPRARAGEPVEVLGGREQQRQRVLGDGQAEGAGGGGEVPPAVDHGRTRSTARRPPRAAAPSAPSRAGREARRVAAEEHEPVGALQRAGPPAAVLDGGDEVGAVVGRDVDDGWLGHGPTGYPLVGDPARDEADLTMAVVPLLSARGLVKSFGGRRILDGLDLELADGARRRARPQRRRQVHAAADPRRARAPRLRRRSRAAAGSCTRSCPRRSRATSARRSPPCSPRAPSWPSSRPSCTPPSAGSPTRAWPRTSTP